MLFGLWTAFVEVIPYIGPWLSAVPPLLYALFADPPWGILWVGILFLFIYQVEGHIVVPNVMANALRLHPLLVIFGLLAGGELYGIAGVLVALPTMAGGRAIWEFFRERVQPRELGRRRFGGYPVEVELEPPRGRQRIAVASARVWERDRSRGRGREPLGRGASCREADAGARARVLAARARRSRARPGDDLRGLSRPLRPLAAVRTRRRGHRAPARRLPLRARARSRRRDRATSAAVATSPELISALRASRAADGRDGDGAAWAATPPQSLGGGGLRMTRAPRARRRERARRGRTRRAGDAAVDAALAAHARLVG